MQKILEEVKSYCSIRAVGRRRIEYFLYWLYTENHKEMKDLAYKFGVLHSPDALTVCQTITNSFIEFKLLHAKEILINNSLRQVFEYNEPITDTVKEYITKESNWIELLKLRNNELYDF